MPAERSTQGFARGVEHGTREISIRTTNDTIHSPVAGERPFSADACFQAYDSCLLKDSDRNVKQASEAQRGSVPPMHT